MLVGLALYLEKLVLSFNATLKSGEGLVNMESLRKVDVLSCKVCTYFRIFIENWCSIMLCAIIVEDSRMVFRNIASQSATLLD